MGAVAKTLGVQYTQDMVHLDKTNQVRLGVWVCKLGLHLKVLYVTRTTRTPDRKVKK